MNQVILTYSDQTVTKSRADWPTRIGTTAGGNATGFSPLSPVAVPLWADPRAHPDAGWRYLHVRRLAIANERTDVPHTPRLRQGGADPAQVQALLGHASIDTAARYFRSGPAENAAVIERIFDH